MTTTLDVALLSSSRAGADLGQTSDVESDASPWVKEEVDADKSPIFVQK